jgi:uncharacterized protein YkwD
VLALALSVWGALSTGAGAIATRLASVPRSCPGANQRPTRANSAALGAATLCLIDRARARHHVGRLRLNRQLEMVAVGQVRRMLRHNHFADGPLLGGRLVAARRYVAHAARVSTAESIGWGTGRYATPRQMVRAWMVSPAHRLIIMSPAYREAGVSVSATVPSSLGAGSRGGTYAIELGVRGR